MAVFCIPILEITELIPHLPQALEESLFFSYVGCRCFGILYTVATRGQRCVALYLVHTT